MKITNFIKSRGIYIFLIFLLSLVFSLLIPNTLLSVISFLLSFSLSFYSLFSYQKKVISLEKEISAYSFFSSFLNSLLSQIGTKQSYDYALQYLLSYQEEVTFESIKENTNLISLYSFQPYFEAILKKDDADEAHLSDYVPLIKKCENLIGEYKAALNKNEKRFQFLLSFCLFFFLIILCLFLINPSLKNEMKNAFFCLYSAFVLPFLFPSVVYFSQSSIKGEKETI